MKIQIISVAHRSPPWAQAAERNYLERLPAQYKIELVTIKPILQGDSAQRLAQEADLIQKHMSKDALLIALDETGLLLSTAQFSSQLRRWHDLTSPICCVIGSADGLAPALKQKAHALLALSKMTLPHALARVVLIEQIYRAHTVETGHPYHRI